VHGETRIRPRAVVWGLVVAACLFAAAAGTGVAAQKPNPKPLWNAYPLDENQASSGGGAQNASTTTTATQPAARAASTTTQPSVTVEQAGDGPPWVLMIVAAAGGALFVVALLTWQGRRARRREEALGGVTDEWPWLTGSARRDGHGARAERLAHARNGVAAERAGERDEALEPAANGAASEWVAERADEPEPAEERGERAVEPEWAEEREERAVEAEPAEEREERAVEPERAERAAEAAANGAASDWVAEPQGEVDVEHPAEPTFDVAEAAEVPRHRFDREPANGPAVAGRRGPICQVRWSAAATCFYAITTDVDGVEHRLAWSPPIEWGEDRPPDEDSREARAAMRVLAKELRDKGWKPMRAKGEDFGEPRWYARRFRFPVVEGDDDATPWLHGPPAAAAHRDD
jgi:hypothetical protein